MSFDLDTLYNLLPAVYRIRDLQQLTGDTSLLGQVSPGDINKFKMPLYALMKVLAEQVGVLEENLAQLYDDQFIETCAEWAIPYIGDLVGYQLPRASSATSLRSDVANTIRHRKRKGTVTLLEQLVRDVTEWDTHVVEYFQLLATTQHVLRPRPDNRLIDLRQVASPTDVYPPSPFETLPHSVEVRNAASGGRYNLANIGIFLWRLGDYRLSNVPVTDAPVSDTYRYLYYFNPLGGDMQLFTHPQQQQEVTQLAGPLAVAAPITRIMLARAFSDYYGRDKSFWLTVSDDKNNDLDVVPDPLEVLIRVSDELYAALTSGRLDFPKLAALSETLYKGVTALRNNIAYHLLAELINSSEILYNALSAVEQLDFQALAGLITRSQAVAQGLRNLPAIQEPGKIYYPFIVADLSDEVSRRGRVRWKASPEDTLAIDPVLGRLTFPRRRRGQRKLINPPNNLRATFSYGFSADMGGGEYHRADSFALGANIQQVASQLADVQAALDALAQSDADADGVVEITDSGRMEGVLKLSARANQRIELRAADYCRPLLELTSDTGQPMLEITGADGAEVTINGLVISNGSLHVTGSLHRLALRHCTLVPGREFEQADEQREQAPSLICEVDDAIIELDHAIVGRLEVKGSAKVSISNSIVDAGSEDRLAYAGPLSFTTEGAALDTLTVENSTIFGRVHTTILNLASNSIFSARQSKDGAAPLLVERRQEGCARFSYIPPGSQVPQRRYHCRPEPGDDTNVIVPRFTSRRYGDAGYAQLRLSTSDTIRSGADDQAEMGAFHDLFQPQRTSNLQLRLQEYLRFGFETGIIFMT